MGVGYPSDHAEMYILSDFTYIFVTWASCTWLTWLMNDLTWRSGDLDLINDNLHLTHDLSI